ncbi:MAG: hypothetical protein ACI8PD_001725 [Nitrospinales bacterium]|jgi:hypothetical protein
MNTNKNSVKHPQAQEDEKLGDMNFEIEEL